MIGLLVAAMLQIPQDTLVVRVPLPSPEPVTAVAPPVTVNVHIQADSLMYARGAEAAERALAVHLEASADRGCGCGVPGWAYAGLLVVGAAAVGALWYHVLKTHQDDDDDDWTDGWITDTGGPDGPFGPPPPAPNTTWPEPHHPHGHQPGNSGGHGKGKGKKPHG